MKRLISVAVLVLTPVAFAQQPNETNPPSRSMVRLSFGDVLFIQLREKGCWEEKANPKSDTPRVTFRITLTDGGHLSLPPELINPDQLSAADASLQALADKAHAALETCGEKGFDLPPQVNGVKRQLSAALTFPAYADMGLAKPN